MRFGDKSTTLEIVGVLMAFLSKPKIFKGKRVIVKVDNLGVVFGIESGRVKNDATAAVFIRALFLISAFLECEIHVEHMPRCSNFESDLVDRMSRLKTTTRNDEKLLKSFGNKSLPKVLTNWFSNPNHDWKLALLLLEYVEIEAQE